jgi:peptide/nickel transport system ATP-binding protein
VDGKIALSLPDRLLTLPGDMELWSSVRGTHIGFTQQDVYGAFDPVIRMGKQMMMIVSERTKHSFTNLENDIRLKLEEVGLKDIDRLWNSYPHELSGGQLQRCQICMATVIQPELLITDEPTSAIDKINQAELLDVFSKLRGKYNMAILCITHEESAVKYLADREVRLSEIEEMPDDLSLPKIEVKDKEPKPILEANQLSYAYRFGGIWSKKGATVGPMSFSLSAGRCLGIIGESGSGKSTLAQLLVGLLEPIDGKLILDGEEIDFLKPKDIRRLRTNVQLVMQDGRGSLHPNFTVGQLLAEVVASQHNHNGEASIEIRKVLQDVKLPENVLDRKPGTLSGGECLRVSIARALLLNPIVLVCDESTSALDVGNRNSIIELLRNLMNIKSIAIIFISHDEYLIRKMADRILVMSEGEVVEEGPSAELLQYPTHAVTKKIFASDATLSGRKHL